MTELMFIYWHKRCLGQVVQWEKKYSTLWSRAVNISIAYTQRSILVFADIWVIGRATMPSGSPSMVLVSSSYSLPPSLSEVPVLGDKLCVHSSCGCFLLSSLYLCIFSPPSPPSSEHMILFKSVKIKSYLHEGLRNGLLPTEKPAYRPWRAPLTGLSLELGEQHNWAQRGHSRPFLAKMLGPICMTLCFDKSENLN